MALASAQPQAQKPRYAPLSPPSCLAEASGPLGTRRVVHNGLMSVGVRLLLTSSCIRIKRHRIQPGRHNNGPPGPEAT
jgi:hypothetical protein